jgi:hypothetical protein
MFLFGLLHVFFLGLVLVLETSYLQKTNRQELLLLKGCSLHRIAGREV